MLSQHLLTIMLIQDGAAQCSGIVVSSSALQIVEHGDDAVAEGRLAVDVLERGGDEGVGVEVAAHLLEVALHGVLAGAIEAKARVSREGELLLCVGIEHVVQADDALLPLADDADEVVDGDGFRLEAVVVEHGLVGPCPLVAIIVLVHAAQGLVECLDVLHASCFDIVQEGVDQLLGGDEASEVHPCAASLGALGLKGGEHALGRGAVGALEM